MRLRRALSVLLPGALVAATGVGAGDLATAGLAGIHIGVAVLWAVAVGAVLKLVLTEGIARWQLASGETILEGALSRFGRAAQVMFLIYLLPWTYFVGAALISACGVTTQALLGDDSPLADDVTARLVWGALHSAVGAALVWMGGFQWFERVMAACIAVMFVAVVATAALLRPDLGALARGLFVPSIPRGEGALGWTVALLGGVGGTLTIICYGYWIREADRTTTRDLATCRIDLTVGYALTGLFGAAMLVIASRVSATGSGVGLVLGIARQLDTAIGPAARGLFLVGAWAAVFSSLLGVWQSVPYIFGDYVRVVRDRRAEAVNLRSWPCRAYLLALAVVPLVQVQYPFTAVQKAYAIFGAAFLPMLAGTLLALNRRALVGEHRNRSATVFVLAATLVFFVWMLLRKVLA